VPAVDESKVAKAFYFVEYCFHRSLDLAAESAFLMTSNVFALAFCASTVCPLSRDRNRGPAFVRFDWVFSIP